MQEIKQKILPTWVLWTLLFLFSGILLFSVGELAVHLIPGPWHQPFFYVYDEELGTWHLSSFSAVNSATDFSTTVSINRHGLRDREREIEKKPGTTRIAVLGDSFTEGVQVNDEETFTRRMEKLLGDNTEVLNFGVAGFGTVQEYLAYKSRVRQFRPDIVILAFLSKNDMRNNSRELETRYGDARPVPFLEKQQDGSWKTILPPPKAGANNPLVLFTKRHFMLYRFLWYHKSALERFVKNPFVIFQAANTTPTQDAPSKGEKGAKEPTPGENPDVYLTQFFMEPSEAVFESAWETTEYTLAATRDAVVADGAQFVLVMLPDVAHVEYDPRAALEREYKGPLPEGFDIDYPEKRLAAFAEKEGISYLDLTPAFHTYRDENHLQSPYFSYPHDGHWTALGHKVAAEEIVQYLKSRSILGVSP
jgi:lysophospholipase L1-like esterase